MPNIKSSIRSVKTDAERRAANGPVKAEIRSTARKVEAFCCRIKDEAQATLKVATSLLDKAARRGTVNKKSRSSQKVSFSKESKCSKIRLARKADNSLQLPAFLSYKTGKKAQP